MNRSEFLPERVFIERDILDSPHTRKILKKLGSVPQEVISDAQTLIDVIHQARDAIREGKKFLLLARQRSRFVKPCPCTPGHVSCRYWNINLDLNCPLDCSYCILQLYLSHSLPTIHINHDDLLTQLDTFFRTWKDKPVRLGTGELGDSLALDHLTGNARTLVEYFRDKEPAVLELKTKTTNIRHLLTVRPAENAVISWSLNSAKIARDEEIGAPSIVERIQAAKMIASHGFPVGFHFDPLILHPGWVEGYAEIIRTMLAAVPPSRIRWISLGCLRFPPALKPVMQARFPGSKIIYEELIPGRDGKLKYFRPIRVGLYQKVIELIRESGGEKIPLYLCMESAEIWQELAKKKGKAASSLRLSPFVVG